MVTDTAGKGSQLFV